MSKDVHPWILQHLKEYAVKHGANMSQPLTDRGKRCQIISFLTDRAENPDATIWARVSDKEWNIPVKIDPVAVTNFEKSRTEPLTSFKAGLFILKDLKLLFTKIPLQGQTGLSKEDQLVVHVGGPIVYFGSKEEPIFEVEYMDRGVLRRRPPQTVELEPIIMKWTRGLRTNNGNIVQKERQDEEAAQQARAPPPPNPKAPPREPPKPIKKWCGNSYHLDFVDDAGWTVPTEQLTRKVPPSRHAPRTPVATEWYPGPDGPDSDSGPEDSGSEEEEIISPIVRQEIPSSQVTAFPWSSSPPHGVEDDQSDDEMIDSPPPEIPCAQPLPPSFESFTAQILRSPTPKQEPNTPQIPPTQQDAPKQDEDMIQSFELPSSWETQQSANEGKSGSLPVEKQPTPPLTCTTIEPSSSNEVSYSAHFPPAQRSSFGQSKGPSSTFSKDEEEESDSESEKSSVLEHLSQLGDDVPSSGEEDELDISPRAMSPQPIKSSLEPKPTAVLEEKETSIVKPVKEEPVKQTAIRQEPIVDAAQPRSDLFVFKRPSPAITRKPLSQASVPVLPQQTLADRLVVPKQAEHASNSHARAPEPKSAPNAAPLKQKEPKLDQGATTSRLPGKSGVSEGPPIRQADRHKGSVSRDVPLNPRKPSPPSRTHVNAANAPQSKASIPQGSKPTHHTKDAPQLAVARTASDDSDSAEDHVIQMVLPRREKKRKSFEKKIVLSPDDKLSANASEQRRRRPALSSDPEDDDLMEKLMRRKPVLNDPTKSLSAAAPMRLISRPAIPKPSATMNAVGTKDKDSLLGKRQRSDLGDDDSPFLNPKRVRVAVPVAVGIRRVEAREAPQVSTNDANGRNSARSWSSSSNGTERLAQPVKLMGALGDLSRANSNITSGDKAPASSLGLGSDGRPPLVDLRKLKPMKRSSLVLGAAKQG